MYIHIIYLCCNVGGCFDDICRAIAPDDDTLRRWVDEECAKFEAEIEKQWSRKVKEVGEDKCRTEALQRMRTFLDHYYVEAPILDPAPWKDTHVWERLGPLRPLGLGVSLSSTIAAPEGPRGPPRDPLGPPEGPQRATKSTQVLSFSRAHEGPWGALEGSDGRGLIDIQADSKGRGVL